MINTIVGCKKEEPAPLPEVTTTGVSDIAYTTAKSGGTIIKDGGSSVTARGVCWSTNASPTIKDDKTIDGLGAGSFNSSITGLIPSTAYCLFLNAFDDKAPSCNIPRGQTTILYGNLPIEK